MAESFAELQADLARWRADPSAARVRDIETIAGMVIPLASARDGSEHVYTCRNLLAGGDCAIYERRPRMCREFPGTGGCHFRGCRSSQSATFGMPWWRRWATRWRWLRALRKPERCGGRARERERCE